MAIKIVTSAEMRRIETAADAGGLSFDQMMENAGRAVAQAIDEWMGTQGRRVLILVGPGNNGGDGLVAARYLAEMGAAPQLYVWKRQTTDDKQSSLAAARGIPAISVSDDPDMSALRRMLASCDILVDALLGTGMARPIEGELKGLLETVRQELARLRRPADGGLCAPAEGALQVSGPWVVALDVPSGLNSDTGELDPVTIPADMTVTMAAVKLGQILSPGLAAVGKLVVADIGIPPELGSDIRLEMATPAWVAERLPARPADAHKGTFGRALAVVGSVNYTGAAWLAGAAATRVGTGLVTLAVPQSIYPAVASRLAEATYLLLPHDIGVLAPDACKVLSEKASDYEALLIGPGLGHEKPTEEFLRRLLAGQKSAVRRPVGFVHSRPAQAEDAPVSLPPLIVDADGLNLLARIERWWQLLPTESILTPHPGEMARLMGSETRQVLANRIACAADMAASWGHIVLLKGAYTVIAAPDGRLMVLPFANPGLATAGSGDVLAGAVLGMRAQRLAPFEAAVVGGYLHGLAGELARDELYQAGTIAGDLVERLPRAIRRLKGLASSPSRDA